MILSLRTWCLRQPVSHAFSTLPLSEGTVFPVAAIAAAQRVIEEHDHALLLEDFPLGRPRSLSLASHAVVTQANNWTCEDD